MQMFESTIHLICQLITQKELLVFSDDMIKGADTVCRNVYGSQSMSSTSLGRQKLQKHIKCARSEPGLALSHVNRWR